MPPPDFDATMRSSPEEPTRPDAPLPKIRQQQVVSTPVPFPKVQPSQKVNTPVPESVPPSLDDQRQSAKLKAKVQDLEEKLALQSRISVDFEEPHSVHKTLSLEVKDLKGWAALITALGALGVGGWATSRTAPEKLDAHTEILSEEAKDRARDKAKLDLLLKYEQERAEAEACRFRQIASAGERVGGYRVGFSADNVEWQSVCLNVEGKVCRGPLFQAPACPPMPEPPPR